MKYKRQRIRHFIIFNYYRIYYFIYNHTYRYIQILIDRKRKRGMIKYAKNNR